MVTGLGAAVPDRILTNLELAEMVDTSDEWIRTRTGIRERRIAADDAVTSDYAAKAAEIALKHAKLSAEELDMIIFATVTPDMYFPAAACFLQEKIGALNAVAYDISAACTGFLYGFSIADGLISAGKKSGGLKKENFASKFPIGVNPTYVIIPKMKRPKAHNQSFLLIFFKRSRFLKSHQFHLLPSCLYRINAIANNNTNGT